MVTSCLIPFCLCWSLHCEEMFVGCFHLFPLFFSFVKIPSSYLKGKAFTAVFHTAGIQEEPDLHSVCFCIFKQSSIHPNEVISSLSFLTLAIYQSGCCFILLPVFCPPLRRAHPLRAPKMRSICAHRPCISGDWALKDVWWDGQRELAVEWDGVHFSLPFWQRVSPGIWAPSEVGVMLKARSWPRCWSASFSKTKPKAYK